MIWLLRIAAAVPILGAGDLRVIVRDPSGASLPNAIVRAGALTQDTGAAGEALFLNLANGRVELSIEALQFQRYSNSVTIRAGRLTIETSLKLATRRDQANVAGDNELVDRFASVLTEKELELLPDDQDEFEQALRAMAGPGAVFRVDGFRGGRLPPKSQIQSVRFRLTPYSAEEHDDGHMIIDIVTKPGLGEWHGNLSFAFGDDSLNARNAYAPRREPRQLRRIEASLLGPVIKNRTSSAFDFSRNGGYDSRTTVGETLTGPFAHLVRLPSLNQHAGARLNHLFRKNHLVHAGYQFDENVQDSIGLFDLPERAAGYALTQHQIRLSGNSSLAERLLGEWRFQAQRASLANTSKSPAPAVIVQGAFARGGATAASSRLTNGYESAGHLTWNKGKHSLRAGGQLDHLRYNGRDFSNGAGTTVFASLAAFQRNRPAQTSRRSAPVNVAYNQSRIGAYMHDDIRARKDLSLSLGLRIEGMTQVEDRVNPSPRAGLAWSPFRHGKTTVRAGGGIYYQWFEGSLYEEILRLNGASQVDLITSAAGVARAGFLQRAANWRLPYAIRFSGGVQQKLPGNLSFMADFRLERGLHQFRSRNANPPGSDLGYLLEIETAARTRMRGALFSLNALPRGPGSRYFFSAFYFAGKTEDETPNPLIPAFARDWGPAEQDIRHRVNVMAQASLSKRWQIGSFLTFNSATPYNITTGRDDNGDTFFNDRPQGVSRNSARGAASLIWSGRVAWSKGFGKARQPGGGVVVVQRRIDAGGGMPDMPLGGANDALFKCQFYVQAANVLNRTNPQAFSGVLGSPLFGRPLLAAPPRRLELGTRISF
ncbi:MAG: carboxypeptidase regulatory-like domain-containing protein [Acidobacteria bacterium]|nr:carboxypeptidase regulatory-like domain-containing protein [Acidobacteriota bacterium]